MAYKRDTLRDLTARDRAAWERRALSIVRKAELLMMDVMDKHDAEHRLTDMVDDVLCTAQNLCQALSKPDSPA